MRFVTLTPGARFVRGPRRSALYDLTRKRLYPLDEWTTGLLAGSLEGQPLEKVLDRMGVRGAKPRRLVSEALAAHPLLIISPQPQAQPPPSPPQGPSTVAAPSAGVSRSGPVPLQLNSSGRLPMFEPGRLARQPIPGGPSPGESAPISRPRRELRFLWLELTERCNLRCVHCYAGSGPGLKDGPMRFEDHRRILREAAEAGCRRVQFTGGEALLDPDLPALVDEARALGFEWQEVYSNGTLLNEERVHFLRDRQVRVAVSFYSNLEGVHERITQVPGSFRRTVEGIRALVRAGVPVRAGLIRMRHNQDDTQGAIDLLVSLGVPRDRITVDDVRPTGRGCGDTMAPAEGRPLMTAPPGGTDIQVEEGEVLGCRTCWSGKITVSPSGDVYPCIFSRELPVGNVLHGSLGPVLAGESLQDLWSIDKAQIPVCRDCEFRYGCFDCRALAFKQTGELRSKPPECTYDPYSGVWGQAAGAAAPVLPEIISIPARGSGLEWATSGDLGLLYSRGRQLLVAVNRAAAEVVRLCDGRRSLDRIASLLARRYRAPREQIARDVLSLARDLAGLGLVELRAA